MSRRFCLVTSPLICLAMTLAPAALQPCRAWDDVGVGLGAANSGLFGPTQIIRIHLELTPDEYRAMQPPPPAGVPGGPPPSPPPQQQGQEPPGDRPSERNVFGVEFPWTRGAITVEDETFRPVGLRYAGNASYMASAGGLKRPFLVELDRFEGLDCQGLRAISLQAGALDPSKAREALALALFREAGVPAPRTSLAEVSLTVPGRFDRAYLGLYTLVEPVDGAFLADRFGADQGLLLRPQGMLGLDYLGENWEAYRGPYRPVVEPTPDQASRLIEFLRLVKEAEDDRFREEIESYLDVEAFLRFMAVQAIIANADGFFTLSSNYALALDPETNRFVFIPGDQELAFANFLLMGSPEQLLDMSITRPYGGPNRLADRLLEVEGIQDRQRVILEELTSSIFQNDHLLAMVTAFEEATGAILDREAQARVSRREPPAGFGPPGVPTAPDLRTFMERRAALVAEQLAGNREGYRPRFNFGPPPGLPTTPVNDRSVGELVEAPPGFEVTLFASPPEVSYPVAVSVAPDGAVYVAVDEQGSLGRTPGGGRVLRCVDEDGDGKADRVTVFARMEHPRGVLAQDEKVWVMHPPFLSVYQDDDGDGVSDRHEVLVSGLTTSQIDERGGDHTTNGIRMGIDGWIYIAVGDYGFYNACGKDGKTLSQRGGGILRVRPDGKELEVFARGLRNPFDIAIDPDLNLFTRDNTNDGAGWDSRISHLIQSAEYGYTQRFANFPDEVMPPLGVYGQGGGTGALWLQDDRWPAEFRDVLLTGDWGRSEVYRHDLEPDGATFREAQRAFLTIPRPTGMDLSGDGRLLVASWRGGEASVYVGPEVGFLASISPPGRSPSPVVDLKGADLGTLIDGLGGPNAVARLHHQREILRRGRSAETSRALATLAADASTLRQGRVAALFALKQLDGVGSHETLRVLAGDASIRAMVLRALTDRLTERDERDLEVLLEALDDPSPRVRAQALIALGRWGDASIADRIIPLTARPGGSPMPTGSPVHAQPDPDRVVPHLANQALVRLGAIDACLEAIDGPHREGALRALRSLHDERTVEGLAGKLSSARSPGARREILATLVRLTYREADYDGGWWGIRPDTTGPYYDPRPWEATDRITSVLKSALNDEDPETIASLKAELARHRVPLDGAPDGAESLEVQAAEETLVVIAEVDPGDPARVGNMSFEEAMRRTLAVSGDADRGRSMFETQSCRACHTDADGQLPKGPHLVEIGKRLSAEELVESILRPSAKIAQGYESYSFAMVDGRIISGFVVSEGAQVVQVRESSGALRELDRSEIEDRLRQEISAMPEGLAAPLTPEQLADLIAYLQSLGSA